MTAQDFLYWLLLFSSSNRVTLFFFLLLLFLPLLTGDRLRPLLQCHLPDQDWGSPTAVFSEPYYRGAGCAADAGFWGPGSFGHWDLLCFPGRGCRPRRDHAPGAGNCHSSHHGRSPWMFYQQSSFILSVTCSKYRVTVSSFIVAPRNWQSLDYNGKDSNVLLCIINAAKVFFARHTSPLKYKPLAVWRPLFVLGACLWSQSCEIVQQVCMAPHRHQYQSLSHSAHPAFNQRYFHYDGDYEWKRLLKIHHPNRLVDQLKIFFFGMLFCTFPPKHHKVKIKPAWFCVKMFT